jgi:hypothetical protein
MTKRITIPFAQSGDKNTVPDTAPVTDDGYANYPDGFPPSNSVDPALGGYYVKRADFNGVLFDITTILKDQAKGLLYTYDATFSTAISGYPVDAILAKYGDIGFWLNITAGNTTNPDTGGAGWMDFSPKAIQNGLYTYVAGSGTTTAYTATFSPAITALVNGMQLNVDIGSVGTNTTTTPTFAPNGLTAHTITRQNGVALAVGDMPNQCILRYQSSTTNWILLNPLQSGSLLGAQVFSTVGTATYTPTAGTRYVIVEGCGGGAAGGSCASAAASNISAGGGGGAGAFGKAIFTSAFSGVTVTIGAGGTPAAAGNNAGGNGGTSSFGALLTLPGGSGSGNGSPAQVTTNFGNTCAGGAGGTAPTGANIFGCKGDTGKGGYIFASSCQTGAGGISPYGVNGYSFSQSVAGVAAAGYGAGGSGAASLADSTARQGGAGSQGIIIVWEYR